MNPSPPSDFVIIDSHGIHSISLQYCNCHRTVSRQSQLLCARLFPATVVDPKTAATFALLEAFQLLSFTSKVSAFEFYQSISHCSNNTGTQIPPVCRNPVYYFYILIYFQDRYRAFLRIVREWRHVRLLKRMGRGHDPDGIEGTREGECAVLCPACPHPGKNLSEDWENAPQDKQ